MDRKVVVPGDLLSEDAKRSGEGTYIKDGSVSPCFTDLRTTGIR